MTVEYDPTGGIFCVACRLQSTSIRQVLATDYHMELSMHLTGITGSLMTFFVVFYNGNVFARYNKLYELTKNMNEYCLFAVSIITREIQDKAIQRKLARMLIASAFLFFFERTESTNDGNISDDEWKQLCGLDLITEREKQALKVHCRKLGTRAAMPSYMLLYWSMKLYRAKISRLNELEKTYWAIRRCQDDVVEIMELPMPFQYFHIMNLMLMLNLTLWAYSLALEDSYFASLIFLFVQLVFQGIRELSVALADPYGDDEADFPLDEWMTQLYARVNCIIEDAYDGKLELQRLGEVKPLKELPIGSGIIDLLIDQKVDSPRVPKKKASRDFKSSQDSAEGAFVSERSSKPSNSSKPESVTRSSSSEMVTRNAGKGGYTQLSQDDPDEEEEEEEEDDDDDE